MRNSGVSRIPRANIMSNSLYKSVSLWVIKIALFVVPLIPLFISKSLFFPYITGKAFIFRIIVELVFLAWIPLAIFFKEYRPRKNVLTIAILVFIFVVSLATILGVNPTRSFWSNFERMEGLLTYLHLAAYFFVASTVFTKKDWLIFFNIFVIVGVIENAVVLAQRLGYVASPQGGVRVDGTIGNPSYLAAYLTFILGVALILWLHSRNKAMKYFYGAVSLLTLFSIYFTATRGAILSLVGAGFVAAVLYLIHYGRSKSQSLVLRRFVLGGLLFLIVMPFGFYLLRNTDFVVNSPVLNRFRYFSFAEARFYIWSMGYEGFKENPVLGWGPENYNLVFAKYFRPELYSEEPWFDRSHNIVLDWLINAGVLGLFSYLGLFAAALYLLWKSYVYKKTSFLEATFITLLMAVYFFQNLFVFDNIATYLSFFALLAYINKLAAGDEEAVVLSGKQERDYLAALVFGVALLPMSFAFYYFNLKPFLSNSALIKAFNSAASGNVKIAFDFFNKAFSYDTIGHQERSEQFMRFSEAVATSGAEDDFKMEVVRKAYQESLAVANENPLDPKAYLILSVVLNRVDELDDMIKVLSRALELAPRKQQIYFELANAYVRAKDYPKAVEILEKAFNLEPRFAGARLNLAAVSILAGDQERADQLLIEGFGTVNYPDRVLAAVYEQKRDYRRLADMYEVFVQNYPADGRYKLDLAKILKALGRIGEARQVLEEAIAINPAVKSQAEKMLSEL